MCNPCPRTKVLPISPTVHMVLLRWSNVAAHVRENYDGLVPRGIEGERQAPLRRLARQHDWHIAHIMRREVRLYPTRHVAVRPLETSFQHLANLLVVRWVGALTVIKFP